MKHTYTIALIGLATVPSILAQQAPTCYSTGTSGASGCAGFIDTFCADVSLSQFGANDNGARCFSAGGFRCDFTAFNSGDSAVTPNEDNCQLVLNNIANRCSLGGEGKVASSNKFIFSLDPNSGLCSTTVQPGT